MSSQENVVFGFSIFQTLVLGLRISAFLNTEKKVIELGRLFLAS